MSGVSGEPRYWFRAKTYGYGWRLPATWEGWVALAAFISVALAASVALPTAPALVITVLLAAGLIALAYSKGEPPL